jgi:beta-xylosidase
MRACALLLLGALSGTTRALDAQRHPVPSARTWTADQGNGTFANPLFYEEFSDPDLIRVGRDYYLTGTTMHAMPGLPVLHSTDLVNWELLSYAAERLDLGPAFRLEGGRESYGRGIWAPSFRYDAGTFHIFSNVNGQVTQHFTATDPRGPWTRTPMKVSLHDLSVLFDDDGSAWVVWGYRDLHLARLDATLTDTVPGTTRALFGADALIGEGAHFYKIDGRYYITSAWYAGRMRMPAARADRVDGPWEINPAISADEDFGLAQGARLRNNGTSGPIVVNPANPASRGQMSMHQGGIVQTDAGEWWGWSMYEGNSLGRLTALSPVTWRDGWPYFGLPGNLGRTPRIWRKPRTLAATPAPVRAPFVRDDAFTGPHLASAWQWNHVPVDSAWSLRERPGSLRFHALAAPDFWWARNTLTQRAIGPRSITTTVLDPRGMAVGGVAGLGLLGRPYGWIGVRRDAQGAWIEQFDERTGDTARVALAPHASALPARLWLRVHTDFLTEQAHFAFSTDGVRFQPLGPAFAMIFQLKTFQGERTALFHYGPGRADGTADGVADFDAFTVEELAPRALTRPIPVGRMITLAPADQPGRVAIDGASRFAVVDRGLGRVALRVGARYVSVSPTSDSTSTVHLRVAAPAEAETFQWIETPTGDLTLLSLATHRYLRLRPDGSVDGDSRGPSPDRRDGTALRWSETSQTVTRRPRVPPRS